MTPDLGRITQHGNGDGRIHPADQPMAAGRVIVEGDIYQKDVSYLEDEFYPDGTFRLGGSDWIMKYDDGTGPIRRPRRKLLCPR